VNTIFAISYLAACGVALFESFVLKRILRETLWFCRFYDDLSHGIEWKILPSGALAPEFSAPLLGTSQILSKSSLRELPSILLFISPHEASSSKTYANLGSVIHALWHRVKGRVYLVCAGRKEQCISFAHDRKLMGFAHNRVKVAWDENGEIARAFKITNTPQAVELDQDARVYRYGRPDIEHVA
jgi:hypothetical protein